MFNYRHHRTPREAQSCRPGRIGRKTWGRERCRSSKTTRSFPRQGVSASDAFFPKGFLASSSCLPGLGRRVARWAVEQCGGAATETLEWTWQDSSTAHTYAWRSLLVGRLRGATCGTAEGTLATHPVYPLSCCVYARDSIAFSCAIIDRQDMRIIDPQDMRGRDCHPGC